jgi:hypothetical protein
MFRRSRKLRLATAILLLVAVPVAAWAEASVPSFDCARVQTRNHGKGCASSNCCCCSTAAACVCQCRREAPSDSPPPVIPDGSGRWLKWIIAVRQAITEILPGVANHFTWSHDCIGFSPLGASIQSRLCVWRF